MSIMWCGLICGDTYCCTTIVYIYIYIDIYINYTAVPGIYNLN